MLKDNLLAKDNKSEKLQIPNGETKKTTWLVDFKLIGLSFAHENSQNQKLDQFSSILVIYSILLKY